MKFLLLFLISFHSIAQSVPTQRDLMKKNGWRLLGIPAEYFRMNFWDEFSDFQ